MNTVVHRNHVTVCMPVKPASEVLRRPGSCGRPFRVFGVPQTPASPDARLGPVSRRQQGFTIYETLFAIVLLTMFAAVAARVLRGAMVTLTAPPPATAGVRVDAAVAALRRDVWAAATVSAPSSHELVLAGGDGQTVRWQIGPGDRLRRRVGLEDRQWGRLFPDATVAVDGAAVRLTVPEARGFRGGQVILVSQQLLLNGGGR